MKLTHIFITFLPSLSLQLQPRAYNEENTTSSLEYQATIPLESTPISFLNPRAAIPVPFPIPTTVDPWIKQTFVDRVLNGNLTDLDDAVKAALDFKIPQMKDWNITNAQGFLLFASGMLKWSPSEIASGRLIYWTLCMFYFILDQNPLARYSVPIAPESKNTMYSLDYWIVSFAKKVGEWMDKPGSISKAAIESFQQSPLYNYDEALVPQNGFQTFNDLFARKLKQGMRPISAPADDSVVVYPADATFKGAYSINDAVDPEHKSNTVTIKHIDWPIEDLLNGSAFAKDFAGGQFMHAFLNAFDYHRQHAPVGGKVVEVNKIQGLAYLNVTAEGSKLRMRRIFGPRILDDDNTKGGTFNGTIDAPDNPGYQFLQTRGLVIIDNPCLGKVAVLPIGMAQVSSVNLTWKPEPGENYPLYPNETIPKGHEISNFAFGGSDIVLVFEKRAKLKILGASGISSDGKETNKQKYLVGMPLGVTICNSSVSDSI